MVGRTREPEIPPACVRPFPAAGWRRFVKPLLVLLLAGIVVSAGCSDSRRPGDPAPDDPFASAISGSCSRANDLDPLPRPPSSSAEGDVVTYPGTSLGFVSFSANGRIQPRGKPTTYYFEYGPTAAYGSKTTPRALAPRLAAFYRESWDGGLAGWKGGAGADLVHVATGGASGGFVRFNEPSSYDYNHADGVGILNIPQYMYPAPFAAEPTASLGGDSPDLRDAKVRVSVRGSGWLPRGSELLWWHQVDVWHGKPPDGAEPSYANWAHTGFLLTDALRSGGWESVEYRLDNDPTQWTFAGTNRELNAQLKRSVYNYAPLDDALSLVDVNFFHMLTFVDPYDPPRGAIDFDDFELAYRNHSVLVAANGGKITSAPVGSSNAAALVDGWRNGEGRTWTSGPSPSAPQEIVFDLENPVIVRRVQIHQNPEWPSKDVEVLVSSDAVTWKPLTSATLPESSALGANFAFVLSKDLEASARRVMVRVTSGYRPERWGLGEVEVFGSGAVMQTDDDWYRVNTDILGLQQGTTLHFRLVATMGGRTEVGGDQVFDVAATQRPEATTGTASDIGGGSARVEGRLNTLGAEAFAFFQYGADSSYGGRTKARRQGPESTPRTLFERIAGLAPGSTVHYRLVSSGAAGTRCGRDMTFVAR